MNDRMTVLFALPAFRWDDPTLPVSPVDRPKEEGVHFGADGNADPAQQRTQQNLDGSWRPNPVLDAVATQS